MKLIYTTQTGGFEQGYAYRNPRYFERIESGAEQVTVVGDWPGIVAAYEKAGVPVSVQQLGDKREGGETDPHKMNVADLKDWLTEQGIEFDAGAKKADLQALIPDPVTGQGDEGDKQEGTEG